MTHPFRKLGVYVYKPMTEGQPYLAFIGPVGRAASEMHFTGKTSAEARSNATKFQHEAIEKHEAALIARKVAARKRKYIKDNPPEGK